MTTRRLENVGVLVRAPADGTPLTAWAHRQVITSTTPEGLHRLAAAIDEAYERAAGR